MTLQQYTSVHIMLPYPVQVSLYAIVQDLCSQLCFCQLWPQKWRLHANTLHTLLPAQIPEKHHVVNTNHILRCGLQNLKISHFHIWVFYKNTFQYFIFQHLKLHLNFLQCTYKKRLLIIKNSQDKLITCYLCFGDNQHLLRLSFSL